jgi:hypothetical protein
MSVLYRIRWLFLLLATQLISAVFTLVKEPSPYTYPDNDPDTHPYFLLSDIEISDNTYWYFIFEHIIPIMVAWYILANATEFRTALKVFLLIHVVDLVDYLLAYGQIWFYVGEAPISWNILKVSFFSLAIINEVLLDAEKSRSVK